MDVCQTFQFLASRVWDLSAISARHQLSLGEETITDTVLLELAMRHPTEGAMYKFNRTEEGKTGADWIWCVTDGHLWFEMLVQAKKLDRTTMTYPRINRNIGNTSTRQIDQIINVANLSGITPMYCFYNFFDVTRFCPPWHICCMYSNLFSNLFGCSMAHAPAIRMQQSHNFSNISRISLPWHCIVCCFFQGGRSLPHRVRNACLELHERGGSEQSVSNLKETSPRYAEVVQRGPVDGVETFERDLEAAMGEELRSLVDGVLCIRVAG